MIKNFVEVLFKGRLIQIEFKENMTLQDLLERLEIKENDPYWIACNRKVILKSDFGQKSLKAGDKIEIFQILSGGSRG